MKETELKKAGSLVIRPPAGFLSSAVNADPGELSASFPGIGTPSSC